MRRRYISILALAALLPSAPLPASGQTPVTAVPTQSAPSGTAVPDESGDTATPDGDTATAPEVSESERRGELASELYKKVKFMLYEGELESNLYPAALEAIRAASEALDAADNQADTDRATSIIIDLNPLMAKGAVYYSTGGDSARQAEFARAYVDTQTLPAIDASKFERDPRLFPQLVYSAAYGATQAGDIEDAKRYFRLYLDSGDEAQRRNVVKYYGQACLSTGDFAAGLDVLQKASDSYPTDIQILTLALQTCLDGRLTDRIPPLLDKALALNPNDEKLLNLRAQIYEHNGEYAPAVDIYLRLAETHPNSLEIRRSIASCYYNLGASHYNSSIMETDEKAATRHRRQSKTYFNQAANALGHVLANTPSDMKYLRALAHSYAAMGEKEKFEEVNQTIRGFGGDAVAFNAMPSLIGNEHTVLAGAQGGTSAPGRDSAAATPSGVPSFQDFASPYIKERLAGWAARGEFEKLEDYKKRVTEGGTEATYDALLKEAEKQYLDKYARRLLISDLKLLPYDADNEIYRIDTPYGPTMVKVPVKGHEAEAFKAGWEGAQLRAPRFMIRDNQVALASITYVVGGKKYEYSAEDALTYRTPRVYVDLESFINVPGDPAGSSGDTTGVTAIFKDSDVDRDIPVTGRKAGNLFALIIANQHYAQADEVSGALHDGDTFEKYCTRTLGIPKENVIMVNNATGNQVRDALASLVRKVKGCGPEAEAIVFYAGHGLPDESTSEAYMMPVDANPLLTSTLIPMKEVYATLGSMPAAATSVFIDACFSGTDREGSMINKARGVALATRPASPEGNMFVLTAASSKETALPYREKDHGLFTYYLLKKLQESKGNATLRQIADYVISNVRNTAESVNGKPQNPTVSTSGTMATSWDSKRLKP